MYIPKLPGFLYLNHARWKGNYNKPYTSIHQKLGSIFVLTQTEAKLRLEGPRAEIEIWQPMPCWPIFGTSVLGATCMLVCWGLGWFGFTFASLFLSAFSRRAPEFERNFYVMPFREACHGLTSHLSSDKTARHIRLVAIGKGAWKADCRPQGGATPWQGLVVCDFTLHSSFARRFADSFLPI